MLALKLFHSSMKSVYFPYEKYEKRKWTKPVYPELCYSGYHVADAFLKIDFHWRNHSQYKINTNRLWIVETRGKNTVNSYEDKVAFSSIKPLRELDISVPFLLKLCKKLSIPVSYSRRQEDLFNRILFFARKSDKNNNKIVNYLVSKWKVSKYLLKRSIIHEVTRRKAAKRSRYIQGMDKRINKK